MPDWRDIGIENFRSAVILMDNQRYRSATSRFYYAVFSIVTQELVERGASHEFRAGQATPSHRQVSDLIERYFLHFSQKRRENIILAVGRIYQDRLNADYLARRVDRIAARQTNQDAITVFRYLGVPYVKR